MLKNYLKIAFRNLNKHKFYASINIAGLATGMTCVMLILLYVLDELRYDRFHENAGRIYRVISQINIGDSEFTGPYVSSAAAGPILQEIPEVEHIVRMTRLSSCIVRHGDIVFTERRVMAADATFFEIFSFNLTGGNPGTALLDPNSVVLTKEKAALYFPQGTAIGKSMTIDGRIYKVTGIMEAVPPNSHFHFDMLLSYASFPGSSSTNWTNLDVYTYMLLREGSNPAALEGKFTNLLSKYGADYQEISAIGGVWKMYAQPITEIHLFSHLQEELEPNGNIRNVYVFSAIGLSILIIACINFMNLATARSAERAREVGVRKALGSERKQLSVQFLTESVMMALLALIMALGILEAAIIPFNHLSGKALSFSVWGEPCLVAGFFGMAVFVGLVSGSYPALYLSRFKPMGVLGGRIKKGGKSSIFRNSLVTFQFVVSIVLIVCTLLVYRQLRFMQNIDLGLNKEDVLVLYNSHVLEEKRETFYLALNQNQISSVSFSNGIPFGSTGYNGTTFLENRKEDDRAQMMNYLRVSHDFINTLGIEIKEGRNFSAAIGTDTTAIILNEAAVARLGLENPIGKQLAWDGRESTIIGITEDYNFQSLRREILPLVLVLDNEQNFVQIKLSSQNIAGTLAFIEEQWDIHTGGAPFDYRFLDENFDALFRSEQRLGNVFSVFTGLAIFIACLGLLGLIAFSLQQRAKEIGIRKILGASVGSIIVLLSGNYMRLILLSILLAIPLSWVLMREWLGGFAYKIEIDWWIFAGAGITAVLIALMTISFQSVKAALANPVDSLRSE